MSDLRAGDDQIQQGLLRTLHQGRRPCPWCMPGLRQARPCPRPQPGLQMVSATPRPALHRLRTHHQPCCEPSLGARPGLCDHCALRRAVDQIIPAEPAGLLAPLRPAILAAEPLTTGRWLGRNTDLLTSLNQGRISLDHATLDTLPNTKAIEHLRALLISTEILPPDPAGMIRRLEHNLDTMLRGLDHDHQRAVTRWIRWKVLPPLRAAGGRRPLHGERHRQQPATGSNTPSPS